MTEMLSMREILYSVPMRRYAARGVFSFLIMRFRRGTSLPSDRMAFSVQPLPPLQSRTACFMPALPLRGQIANHVACASTKSGGRSSSSVARFNHPSLSASSCVSDCCCFATTSTGRITAHYLNHGWIEPTQWTKYI